MANQLPQISNQLLASTAKISLNPLLNFSALTTHHPKMAKYSKNHAAHHGAGNISSASGLSYLTWVEDFSEKKFNRLHQTISPYGINIFHLEKSQPLLSRSLNWTEIQEFAIPTDSKFELISVEADSTSERDSQNFSVLGRSDQISLIDDCDNVEECIALLRILGYGAYADRLSYLHSLEDEEDELPMSIDSLKCFSKFSLFTHDLRRGQIGLSASGNIVAEWDGGDDQHLSLRFLDHDAVKFVAVVPDTQTSLERNYFSGLVHLTKVFKNIKKLGSFDWVNDGQRRTSRSRQNNPILFA